MKHPQLHPLFDQRRATIEFRVALPQASVYVVLTEATMASRFPVPEAEHGLLIAYEGHRDEIDAAVIRLAATEGAGNWVMRPTDMAARPLSA
jgi:hypothetical protein